MLYEFDQQQAPSLSITEPTDEQLMERLQARDETALTILHRRYTPFFRSVVGKILNNSHDVDELVVEVFWEVWNRSAAYNLAKGKPLGWMVTMARRRAIDRVRRRQAYDRAGERLRIATETSSGPSWSEGSDVQADANERTAIFQRLLQALTAAQCEVVRLAYYGGLSQREIAARLNIPLGTIKTRLELGVRKLRTAIQAAGGAEEWASAL